MLDETIGNKVSSAGKSKQCTRHTAESDMASLSKVAVLSMLYLFELYLTYQVQPHIITFMSKPLLLTMNYCGVRKSMVLS